MLAANSPSFDPTSISHIPSDVANLTSYCASNARLKSRSSAFFCQTSPTWVAAPTKHGAATSSKNLGLTTIFQSRLCSLKIGLLDFNPIVAFGTTNPNQVCIKSALSISPIRRVTMSSIAFNSARTSVGRTVEKEERKNWISEDSWCRLCRDNQRKTSPVRK
jgi:hypothetical protein